MKTAFINARIRTVDADNSLCSAMLVEDGRIALLGTDAQVLAAANGCPVTDLGGRDVLPGFIDAHLHLMDNALFAMRTVPLGDARSVDDVVRITRDWIREHNVPDGEWVTGFGWDQELYGAWPTCRELDAISDTHPIMLDRRCGTICTCNSAAMRIAGIDKDTPDPQGGELMRFEDGSPTGVMLESAMSLIGNCVPKVRDKQLIRELLAYSAREVLSHGIVLAHTEDFCSVGDKHALWEAYLELAAEDILPIDLVLQLRIHREEQLQDFFDFGFRSWQRFGRIKVGPIKCLGDGCLGGRSAGLNAPYSDAPGTSGCLYWSREEFARIAKRVVDRDFDLTIHAIGDAAVEIFLDGCLSVNDELKRKGMRPSVIHSQIMSDAILEKYAQTGAVALVQPMYIHSDWSIADDRVGDRIRTSYCWRTMLDRGLHVAAGSDMPIESVDPFDGIQVNVTRRDLSGRPEGGWHPEERLTRLQAVRLHTIDAAYASKDEDSLGSLEVGKRACFNVVSGDVFGVPEDEIRSLRVLATYIDGVMKYSAKE